MKMCSEAGWIRQHWLPKGWLSIAGVMLISTLLSSSVVARAAGTGRYVLVKTVVDRNKQSTTGQGDVHRVSAKISNGSYTSDDQFLKNDGSLDFTVHKEWSFNSPPAELSPGQEFTITATGSVSTTEKDGVAATQFDVGGGLAPSDKDNQGNVDNRALARTDLQAQVTKVFHLKAPEGPEASQINRTDTRFLKDKFEINLAANGLINDYYYEWQGGSAAAEGHLQAELECGTLELLPGQRTEPCHIIISGWCRNTGRRVEVVFPLQTDGFGAQGKTGIVVPIGQGSEDTANMSGARGPDGSYGKVYLWTLFVRARSTAPVGTQTIPIIVRQEGCGEVKLALTVRVVPGRTQQSGPNRGGEGTKTGGTGVTPPITQATSSTGLSARLGSNGTLVLVPGQVSESCTIFIKGWRTNTGDPVEVFLPQESKPQGNLGNDLVAFPGSSSVDPANMGQNSNGEYGFGIGFRAMENAPNLTTPIQIIVRQKGHEDVRLLLNLVVRPKNDNGGGTGPGIIVSAGGAGGPFSGGPGSAAGGAGTPGTKNQPGSSVSEANRRQADQFIDRAGEFYAQEKWSQAEAEFQRALRLDPTRDDACLMLGEAYFEQKKWTESVAAYRELVKLVPDSGANHADLAHALLRGGQRDEALKEAREAIRLGTLDHPVYAELGLHP